MDAIPAFLLHDNQPRFLVSDDGNLIIAKGEQTIVLDAQDIERLSRFVQKFDKGEPA